MPCDPGPEAHLYRLLREDALGRLGRPHERLSRRERGHLRGGEIRQRGDGALDVLEPRRGIEAVQDDERREFDDGVGQRGRILRGDEHGDALVPHLADHVYDVAGEVGIVHVLVRLVEDNQLVIGAIRRGRPLAPGVGEDVEHHHEEAQRLVLLDELVAQVHNDQPPRMQHRGQAAGIVHELRGEVQTDAGNRLLGVAQFRGFDFRTQRRQRHLVAQLAHNQRDLLHIHLVAKRAHQEAPVLEREFGRAEVERLDLHGGELGPPQRNLIVGGED